MRNHNQKKTAFNSPSRFGPDAFQYSDSNNTFTSDDDDDYDFLNSPLTTRNATDRENFGIRPSSFSRREVQARGSSRGIPAWLLKLLHCLIRIMRSFVKIMTSVLRYIASRAESSIRHLHRTATFNRRKRLSEVAENAIRLNALLCGLPRSGKSCLLYRMKLDTFLPTIPTVDTVVEEFDYQVGKAGQNIRMRVWDVGRRQTFAPAWQSVHWSSDCVIFVVDAADKKRLQEARTDLFEIMFADFYRLIDTRFLILANKQDVTGSLTRSEVQTLLALPNELKDRWRVVATSSVTGEGIREGIKWLGISSQYGATIKKWTFPDCRLAEAVGADQGRLPMGIGDIQPKNIEFIVVSTNPSGSHSSSDQSGEERNSLNETTYHVEQNKASNVSGIFQSLLLDCDESYSQNSIHKDSIPNNPCASNAVLIQNQRQWNRGSRPAGRGMRNPDSPRTIRIDKAIEYDRQMSNNQQ